MMLKVRAVVLDGARLLVTRECGREDSISLFPAVG
jgi:hypothetical protein